jgi:hypothetical protein
MPIVVIHFSQKLGFVFKFYYTSQVSVFTKIRSVEAEMFLADKRMDRQGMMKPVVSFHNYFKKEPQRIYIRVSVWL